jgi:nitrosocyanin
MILAVGACGGSKTDHLTAKDGPDPAGGNAITPVQLKAKKGDTVEIKVTNTAPDKPHGFTVENYNVVQTIQQGQTVTVKFKADRTGTFKVFCQLHPTHRPAQLVVT